jgi:hypothetical protein
MISRSFPSLSRLAQLSSRGRCEAYSFVGQPRFPTFSLRFSKETGTPVTLGRFLAADAYRPLPTLVDAARELFHTGNLHRAHRAAAVTDGAVEVITEIARDAAATGTRRLVLLTGVPGAGKTLVGLRIVRAHMLDDLASPRQGRKPAAPAVFLSGKDRSWRCYNMS